MHAVAEAARNVACTGARPWAVTNCLNFGNPEKPEVMWQFSQAVDGIAEACRALGTPVTGGNVSFYNETLGKSIYPTPIIGMLGLLEDPAGRGALGMAFRAEDDVVVLLDGGAQHPSAPLGTRAAPLHDATFAPPGASLRQLAREFSSSEYAKAIRGIVAGTPPAIDLEAEKRLIELVVALAGEGLLCSAHDVSDGGLAVTLAECCFASAENLGAEIALHADRGAASLGSARDKSSAPTTEPAEVALFGERGARAVVSLSRDSLARLEAIARQYGVRARALGTVTHGEFRIQYNGRTVVNSSADVLRDAWAGALERALRGQRPRNQ